VRLMLSPLQLRKISLGLDRGTLSLVSIATDVQPHDDYPWGELKSRHVVVKYHNADMPGWRAIEFDWGGEQVHEWTGGND
jgi:hypothetical protein